MVSQYTAVPKQFLTTPSLKRRTRVFFALIALTFLTSLFGLTEAAKASREASSLTPAPDYHSVAEQVLWAWLEGKPSPFPVAQGLQRSLGRTPATNATAPASMQPELVAFDSALHGSLSNPAQATNQSWVTDTYYVTTKTGVFLASVTLVLTPSGPVVAADPSLAPVPVANGHNVPPLDYTHLLTNANPPNGVTTQVDSWANAYASNDQEALFALTGDTRAVTFGGLGGWSVVGTPNIVGYYPSHNTALVRVEVQMSENSSPQVQITADYDLLLGNISNALPNVWAWGPAGSGLSLTQYQNAVG